MGRLFLQLGCLLAVVACVVSVIGFFLSVSALVSGWGTVTIELAGRPLFWAYAFVINGALCVVFNRALETEPRGSAPSAAKRPPA